MCERKRTLSQAPEYTVISFRGTLILTYAVDIHSCMGETTCRVDFSVAQGLRALFGERLNCRFPTVYYDRN